ncbi:MAG: hypothetical protein H7A33_03925 [Deltaproteobacteria bacterium]|nr:hypothetical protein [Deltaproteobacteria bacterium]
MRFIKRLLKSNKGFSVVENIMATTIMAVGLMGGMVVMQNSVLSAVQGDQNTVASRLASEKLEQLMADKEFLGYDYISDGNYGDETVLNFERSVDIAEVSSDDFATASAGSGLKKVTVEVTWGDADYEAVRVSTLISDYNF